MILVIAAFFLFTSVPAFLLVSDQTSAPEPTIPASTQTVQGLTLETSPRLANVNQTVTFFANATSSTGAGLTFRLNFISRNYPGGTNNTASSYSIQNTSSPGTAVFTYVYNRTGIWPADAIGRYFTARVWCSDGVTTSKEIKVYVDIWAPVFTVSVPPVVSSEHRGEPFNFSINVTDQDNNTVTVFWDFGDGTNKTDIITGTNVGVWVNESHIYNPPGPGGIMDEVVNYTLNVTITDTFNHTVNTTSTVPVIIPPNWFPIPNMATDNMINYAVTVGPDVPVNLYANASDREGDALTWTFLVKDSGGSNVSIMVSNTPASAPNELVWNNQTYTFTGAGIFTVELYVSDAALEYQGADYMHNFSAHSLVFTVTVNKAPYVGPVNAAPDNPLINTSISTSIEVKLFVYTNDEDGDFLNITWDFGDGSPPKYNETAGGVMTMYIPTQYHNYTDGGSYNVTVTVDDAHGHRMVVVRQLNVSSNNLPPDVISFLHAQYREGDLASPNETLNFTLIVADPEGDVVVITWDFGDGTPIVYTNITDFAGAKNVTIHITHVYTKAGNYTLNITLTDNKVGALTHFKAYNMTIKVGVHPPKIVIKWDWWDYTSVGLLGLIPVGIVVWGVRLRQRHKQIEQQGMSYDEWKLRKELDMSELGGDKK